MMHEESEPTVSAPSDPAGAVGAPGARVAGERSRKWGRRLGGWLVAAWTFVVGASLTQVILGGVIIIGWTFQAMRRTMMKAWWKRSVAAREGLSFASWMQARHPSHCLARWPNWLVEDHLGTAWRAAAVEPRWRCRRRRFGLLTAAVRRHVKGGLQGLANAWVLTMPGCLLMLFSWYDGWNNSFNKGYEQAAVGPLMGVLGIALFIGAMLYVPLAQARQAATGDWRSFYQFRLVWSLARRHWLGCLLLAVGFSVLSLPLVMLKTAPYFLAHKNDTIANFTPKEVLQFLNSYFFWCGFLVFPAWVALRLIAARIYASGVLNALQKGWLPVSMLGEEEQRTLQMLDLIQVHPPRSRHVLIQVAAKTGASLFVLAGLGATALVWFTFVAQVYISEFIHYHPGVGWLNQPLAQLPWFRYIPPGIQNPLGEAALNALLLLLAFGSVWMVRRLRSFWHQARPSADRS